MQRDAEHWYTHPVPGGVAPKFGSEKVSRYTGVSQLQLQVSRCTVQLSLWRGLEIPKNTFCSRATQTCAGATLDPPKQAKPIREPVCENGVHFWIWVTLRHEIIRDFMLLKCPGKKDIFKELRVRFVIFLKIIISE